MRHKQIKKVLNNAELVKKKQLSFSAIRFINSVHNGTISLKRDTTKNTNDNIELYDYIEHLNWDLTAFDDEVIKNFHSCKNEKERVYCLNEYRTFLYKFKAIEVKFLPAVYRVFLSMVKKHFPFDDVDVFVKVDSQLEELNTTVTSLTEKNIKEEFNSFESPAVKESYEIALRHWFLEVAKIEPMIFGKDIRNKYNGTKKVEVHLNDIRKFKLDYNKKGLLKQLNNVFKSLSEYPELQKTVKQHLDKIE